MNGSGSAVFRFEGIEVDTAQYCIHRNGEEIHLRQRSLEVLLYLIENHHRVVSKTELIDKIWKIAAVTEDALVQSIVEIRKALGEDSRNPRFIKTIPKAGYRFIARLQEPPQTVTHLEEVHSIQIEVEDEEEKDSAFVLPLQTLSEVRLRQKRRFPVAFSAILAILIAASIYVGSRVFREEKTITLAPARKSIVVFFFDNLSGTSDLNWMREGLAEMMITGLSRSGQLGLPGRQQVRSILERSGHKESEKIRLDEAMEIAQTIHAEHFLLGGFIKAGNRIRIDIQLYKTADGKLVGAEDLFLNSQEEVLTKIDLLSLKVASRMGVTPTQDQSSGVRQVMTDNLDAYRYYSLAVEKAQGLQNTEAIHLLEKAIALDPDFAMAHARIGYTYAVKWNYPDQAKPHLQRAFQLSNRLTEKDKLYINAWYAIANQDYSSAISYLSQVVKKYPFEVEAYVRLGDLLVSESRYQEAKEIYERGLLIDPQDKLLYNSLGGLASSLGKHDEAIQNHQMYVKLAPSDPNSHDSLGLGYQTAGFYQKAIQEFNRAIELNPDFEVAVVHLGNCYFQTGRYEEAIRQYRRYIQIAPSDGERRRGNDAIAYVYWKKRKPDQAAITLSEIPLDPAKSSTLVLLTVDHGDPAKAELYKSQFLTQKPGRGQRLDLRIAYFPAGYFFLKNGNSKEAIRIFKEALKDLPPTWNIETFEDCLANAYLELGRFDEAILEYERVLRFNPKFPLAHFHLAEAYQGKGLYSQARREFQTFLDDWKDADRDIPEIIRAQKAITERQL